MRERLRAAYTPGEQGERCPGEDDCERFQSANPQTRDRTGLLIGKQSACMLCPLKLTKITRQSERVDRLVEKVEVLAAEAKLGIVPDAGRLTPLEYDLLILYQRQEALYERELRLLTISMLQARGGGH